jgi:GTP:adenosylcobinamide-phosphate guanylyltransferase
MENKDLIQISSAEMVSALNRSEVDIQVATAKQYPRVLSHVLNQIETYATMDTETAEDCFYALRRNSGGGEQTVIEGVSVRLAEIIAGAWGNMRVQTRIIGNDGRTITVQGMCHDLETNLAVSVEVKRRITDRYGKTFSEDMQVVTGNAASAIAFRNAVLKVVPKAVTKNVIDKVKNVALGQSIDLETVRQRLIGYYAKLAVPIDQLLSYLGITDIQEMDKEKCFELKALANAIKEGTTTVKESFAAHTEAARKEAMKSKEEKVSDKKKEMKEKKAETKPGETPSQPNLL